LALRYQKSSENAVELANWLDGLGLPRVIFPGLDGHPQHEVAKKQQRTPDGSVIYGNMISIDVGSNEVRDRFLEKLSVFTLAESLGGVESLCCVPFDMTHSAVPVERKLKMGITESLIRLSIGIEDVTDLKADLQNALSK